MTFDLLMAVILNAVLAVMEITANIALYRKEGKGMFRFFTEDSNIFALFVSLLFIFMALMGSTQSAFLQVMRYVATCALMLTFLTVVFVLAPCEGKGGFKKLLLKGQMLYMHFLCPLISFVSFVFFEDCSLLPGYSPIIAFIPVFIYGIVMICLNISGKVVGPYPFLKIKENGAVKSVFFLCLMILASLLINTGVYLSAVHF